MRYIYSVDTIELKKIMVENKLEKIVDLSEKSGVDRNTLSKVLNGDIRPSTLVIDKLIDALDIPIAKAGNIFFVKNLRNAKEN